jgi:hypothetical protein
MGMAVGETLESRYAGDAVLLELYKRKLLKHGWAGKKDAVERECIHRAGKRVGLRKG